MINLAHVKNTLIVLQVFILTVVALIFILVYLGEITPERRIQTMNLSVTGTQGKGSIKAMFYVADRKGNAIPGMEPGCDVPFEKGEDGRIKVICDENTGNPINVTHKGNGWIICEFQAEGLEGNGEYMDISFKGFIQDELWNEGAFHITPADNRKGVFSVKKYN